MIEEFKVLSESMKARALFLVTVFLSTAVFGKALADPASSDSDSTSIESSDSLKSSLTFLPAVFYTPETKLGFGVYPNYIFRFSNRCKPSNVSFLAYYTVNKQISISVDPNLYFRDNDYILSGTIFFEKWPNSFYGFGTNISRDNEEDYTTRNTGFEMDVRRRIFKNLYAGLTYEFNNIKFLKVEEGGALASGYITGSESGVNAGTGVSISWDGRDNIFSPSEGEFLQLESSFFGRTTGGDYTYNDLTVDLRKYYSLGPPDVLAFQLYGDFISGDAPFNYYSKIGDIVRGYLPALYIEKKLVAAQIEYRRIPVWGRFGFTLFAGTGSVAGTISDFKHSKFKFAAGFGLRYALVESEKVNIRIDYGIGDDSAELYLDVTEAF